mmetsp:Transcript_40775/g.134963  ORF Transcript_40775/g.134963 Transcript_40775/m.134963 type:complete len:244 (-) Transcript_40775:192-923(-)
MAYSVTPKLFCAAASSGCYAAALCSSGSASACLPACSSCAASRLSTAAGGEETASPDSAPAASPVPVHAPSTRRWSSRAVSAPPPPPRSHAMSATRAPVCTRVTRCGTAAGKTTRSPTPRGATLAPTSSSPPSYSPGEESCRAMASSLPARPAEASAAACSRLVDVPAKMVGRRNVCGHDRRLEAVALRPGESPQAAIGGERQREQALLRPGRQLESAARSIRPEAVSHDIRSRDPRRVGVRI